MNDAAATTQTNRWVAAIRGEELVAGHVAVARLDDADIALWRDVRGRPNAWENRCPHRGMRLSFGSNIGDSLVCRYHGWRFDSRTAACSFIPAHPRQTAPKAAAVRTYASIEKYGYVWIRPHEAASDVAAREPELPGITAAAPLTFRSLTFHAPAEAVRRALRNEPRAVELRDWAIRIDASLDGTPPAALYLIARHSASATLVHGLAVDAVAPSARLPLLRAQNEYLKALREQLESESLAAAGST
jgi:vanillate O-demethylase ferredoxin subunit